jgi:hypothetical protein
MSESTEKPSSPRVGGGAVVSLLVAQELRWLYFVGLGFLLLAGTALSVVGVVLLHQFLGYTKYSNEASPAGAVTFLILGLLVFVAAFAIYSLRRYFYRIQELAVAEIKNIELSKINEKDFEKVDEILRIREEKARVDFERNLSDPFLISFLELSGGDFFGPCSWRLQPGVNVLLGRNGFGKSLLLLSLASLLQRNEEVSNDLFESASDDAFMRLTVERNGVPESIRRERRRFTESAGKIPILAIPDTRFVNRLDTSIAPPPRTML